jgi:hypothetical protein
MKAFRSFALVLAIVISAVSLYSQTSEGRILGTVFDQSGAVIAGAKVTITNTATSVSRQLVTTSARGAGRQSDLAGTSASAMSTTSEQAMAGDELTSVSSTSFSAEMFGAGGSSMEIRVDKSARRHLASLWKTS